MPDPRSGALSDACPRRLRAIARVDTDVETRVEELASMLCSLLEVEREVDMTEGKESVQQFWNISQIHVCFLSSNLTENQSRPSSVSICLSRNAVSGSVVLEKIEEKVGDKMPRGRCIDHTSGKKTAMIVEAALGER